MNSDYFTVIQTFWISSYLLNTLLYSFTHFSHTVIGRALVITHSVNLAVSLANDCKRFWHPSGNTSLDRETSGHQSRVHLKTIYLKIPLTIHRSRNKNSHEKCILTWKTIRNRLTPMTTVRLDKTSKRIKNERSWPCPILYNIVLLIV